MDKNPKRALAVHISDIPVILKQSQGRQTWNDNIDPKQGYINAKFERSYLNGVREQTNVNGFS